MNNNEYRVGVNRGLPVGMGYFSVSFGFGAMAVSQGLKTLDAVLISATNLTSAGQFAGLTLIVAAATLWEMVLTQLVINSRYALMSLALSQRMGEKIGLLPRLLIAFFNFSHKWPTFAFTSESGYTLGFRRKIAHKGTHGETGGVLGGGWYHYPRSVPHVSETLRGQGVERQTLPLLGLGRGCSRRTQKAFGTAMRLCVSLSRRRRGPAGLRDFFHF